MKRQHKGRIERAADILRSLLVEKQWQRRINLHQVFLFWEDVVGSDIAAHAEPDVIRGTVLWIRVSDSVWMQQLHLQKITLLEMLNRRLKEDQLSDLRFRIDVHAGGYREQPEARKPRRRKKAVPVPAELESMISLLECEETREALRSLWSKAHEEE